MHVVKIHLFKLFLIELLDDRGLGGYSGKGGINKKQKLFLKEGHKFDNNFRLIL